MQQIHPENWVVMYFGLIFLITGAQMLVVYVLSDAGNPTPGLGLYTVYFMAALLGWIAFALQQGSNVPMAVDIPSVASVLNSYVLFHGSRTAGGDQARTLCAGVYLPDCVPQCVLSPAARHVWHASSHRRLLFCCHRPAVRLAQLEKGQCGRRHYRRCRR